MVWVWGLAIAFGVVGAIAFFVISLARKDSFSPWE